MSISLATMRPGCASWQEGRVALPAAWLELERWNAAVVMTYLEFGQSAR